MGKSSGTASSRRRLRLANPLKEPAFHKQPTGLLAIELSCRLQRRQSLPSENSRDMGSDSIDSVQEGPSPFLDAHRISPPFPRHSSCMRIRGQIPMLPAQRTDKRPLEDSCSTSPGLAGGTLTCSPNIAESGFRTRTRQKREPSRRREGASWGMAVRKVGCESKAGFFLCHRVLTVPYACASC